MLTTVRPDVGVRVKAEASTQLSQCVELGVDCALLILKSLRGRIERVPQPRGIRIR
ncbi:hypothetical protein [Microbacterium schleiferi]|jgi:hypothetical protein|uniref:Uncharacterized protein n=1 Tax=Microbacterium schleiferi TaxID=69362 RepID=A0ABU7V634_9MICO